MPRDPVVAARHERLEQVYNPEGMTALGHLITNARSELDMTRAELAAKIGVSKATMWRVEAKHETRVSDTLADRIANALGIDVFEIHAAQGTIPPALRERVAIMSASDMHTLYGFMERGT